MMNLVRFLLIVPPTLLSFFVHAQLEGKIQLLPDKITYQVSLVPTIDWGTPFSITNNAQMTVRAPAGSLEITNFQSVTGTWNVIATIDQPSEAPTYEYFSFALTAPMAMVEYESGVELVLFTFENNGPCTPIEVVDNITDPFMPPNSQSINIGNYFTVLAAGPGVNAYSGNTSDFMVPCIPLLVSAISDPPIVSCTGDVAEITITTAGGVEPYTVNWENTTTLESGTEQILDFEGGLVLMNMSGGDYVFFIVDATDSLFTLPFSVGEPDAITFDLTSVSASCNGSADGSASITNIAGGTLASGSNYDIKWGVSGTPDGDILPDIDPGNYSVTIQDDNGCTSMGSIEVGTDLLLDANPTFSDVSCGGAFDGTIELNTLGNNAPFSYEWTGNNISSTSANLSGLAGGTYSYTVTDATGICNTAGSITIAEPLPMELEYVLTEPTCQTPDEASIIIKNVQNAINGYQVSLDGLNFSTNHEFQLTPGDFQTFFIKDGNGCEIVEEIQVKAYDAPQVLLNDMISINLGDEVELNPILYPATGLALSWSNSETLSCDDCPNPIASPQQSTTYRLTATDSSGCRAEGKVSFIVSKNRYIYTPNVFSPNGDGFNDYFTIFTGKGITSVKELRVFNRWGELMFEADNSFVPNDVGKGWDGTFNGEPMKEGVYIFSAVAEYSDGLIEILSGEVNLLR